MRLLWVSFCLGCLLFTGTVKAEPLTIEKQGSFSAGSSVKQAAKKFDPLNPTTQKQTLHGDHASVFIRLQKIIKICRLFFCMALASLPAPGNPRQTAGMAF